jgi:ribonuclease HI
MEMTAAIEALRSFPEPAKIALFTDSRYLQKGITHWIHGWRARGWRTRQDTEVLNQDLWRDLDALLSRHEVNWQWTKGHAGNRWNEQADQLARAARNRFAHPHRLPVVSPASAPSNAISAPMTGPPVMLYTGASADGRAGAWAAVLKYGDKVRRLSGRVPEVSANRMHLAAVIEGLRALTRPVEVHIHTSSGYVRDGASRWLPRWRANGWRTEEKKPVANADLWRELVRLQDDHRLVWVATEETPAAETTQAHRLAALTFRGAAPDSQGMPATPPSPPDALTPAHPAPSGSSNDRSPRSHES